MPPAFRYFERVDDDAGQYEFWEVALDGPTLDLRHGPVGTAGKHERETCASEAAAQHEYQLQIHAHLARGFREVADRRLDARTRALEDAIDADPDDVNAYLVYADWIQTLGDARGGLIVAQHAGESDPEAAKRAAAYLKQHEAVFLGPLASHVGYDGAVVDPTWRCGYIRRARILTDGMPSATRMVEAFLEHASTRWLGELSVGSSDWFATLQPIIDVLADHPLPHLRVLDLDAIGERGDRGYDYLTEAEYEGPEWVRPGCNLMKLWAAVPGLRRLVLRGEAARIGALKLPELAHLELHTRELAFPDLYAITHATGPLERLEIRFLWPHGEDLADRLRTLFQCPLLRGLDHLAITGSRHTLLTGTDGLCTAIAQLRTTSLRSLDLSHSRMTDAGADVLAASSLDLDLIDVSRTLVSRRGLGELERIAKLVIG